MAPILYVVDAVNWTRTVNRALGTAMRPDEVAALPEDALWVIGAMLDRESDG